MTSNCYILSDSFEGYSTDIVNCPKRYQKYIDHVLVPHGLIKDRIVSMAKQIIASLDNENRPLLAVCILQGAFRFYADIVAELSKQASVPVKCDFIRLRSYVGLESRGVVKVIGGAEFLDELASKNVIIIEDIIDTGTTMTYFLDMINRQKSKPHSVKVASLLLKRTPNATSGYRPDFVGFEIPDRFVVGYGIDYNNQFRDVDHVCVINKAAVGEFST